MFEVEDFLEVEVSAAAWSVEAADFFDFEVDFEEVEEVSLADDSSVDFFFLDFEVVVSVWSCD